MNYCESGDKISNSEISTSVNFLYDRCPVCEKIGKSLACSQCTSHNERGFLVLQQGQLREDRPKLASVMYIPRVLQETLQQFHDSNNERIGIKERFGKEVDNLSRKMKLESEILHCTSNVQRLKQVLQDQRKKLHTEKNLLNVSLKTCSAIQRRINRTLQKKVKLEDFINKEKTCISTSMGKIQNLDEELRTCRRDYVTMLTQYIFPIKEVKRGELLTGSNTENRFGDQEDPLSCEEKKLLRDELDEARRLSFVNGRWIDLRGASSEFVQISVATENACALPDGDYSAYESWLQANHNSSSTDPPSLGTSVTNLEVFRGLAPTRAVLGVGVVLCHATQMLLVIRKILGIHLPHKVHYGTFTNPAISPHVFINNVKLLNCNLLSVCLQQGVDGSTLHPLHTLRNLQILTEKLIRDGERKLPCLPSANILQSMEVTLALADVSDDDSDPDLEALDWQLSFDTDWESSLPGETTTRQPSLAYVSTNTQSSILTQPSGLVSSALNWATKGWWGRDAD